MDHVLGRTSEKSGYGVSFGTVRIIDPDFADDAVIFAGTTKVLAEALGSKAALITSLLSKTMVQAFGDVLDVTIESIPVSSENVGVTQTFT